MFKILNFNIFFFFFFFFFFFWGGGGGGGSENEYFLGYEDFVIFFFWGGSSQNWIIFRAHFYAFYGLFLRSMYKMGDIFLGC